MSYVEVPLDEARAILAETAIRIGYEPDFAKALAWSAWWLENRSVSGVSQLIVYLGLVKNLDPEDRAPRSDPEYGMRCVCPVQAAGMVWSHVGDKESLDRIGFRGPASQLLMAPSLVFCVRDRGYGIRLRYLDQSVVFWNEGVLIESESLANYAWVDPGIKDPTLIEFLKVDEMELDGIHQPYRRLDRLKLPSVRMTGAGTLDLSDKPARRK